MNKTPPLELHQHFPAVRQLLGLRPRIITSHLQIDVVRPESEEPITESIVLQPSQWDRVLSISPPHLSLSQAVILIG
jgi:hypothetical protein